MEIAFIVTNQDTDQQTALRNKMMKKARAREKENRIPSAGLEKVVLVEKEMEEKLREKVLMECGETKMLGQTEIKNHGERIGA